jgi:urease accessory protein
MAAIATIIATTTAMTTSIRTTAAMAEPRPLPELKLVETTGPAEPAANPAISPEALKKLLAWLSPAFPVGGFSYSHGLEWAIEDGTVKTAADLEAWVAAILRHGAGRSDGILLAHAHRAAVADDAAALDEINALAIAFQPTKERHLEATAQGRAFLTTVAATWPNDRLAGLAGHFKDRPVAYAVAVGIATGCHDVPPGATLNAFLGAFAANLVSAAIRAVPLGQTEGQRVIANLSPVVEEIAATAATASLDELGGAAWRADIASMKHETQYTRLFRS